MEFCFADLICKNSLPAPVSTILVSGLKNILAGEKCIGGYDYRLIIPND